MIGLMTDHRHGSWMFVCCAAGSVLLAGVAAAQPAAGPAAPRAERPAPAVMQVAPVDPKLEALLKEWERKTAGIKTLHGEHFRREYNDVFAVEKQSSGKFWFAAPDRGRIDMRGEEPAPKQVGRKKQPNGAPFKVEAGQDQSWICNGREILVVDPPQKQFERLPIPPELQGDNINRSPLPFLFGMKAEDAKRRYRMKLVQESPEAAVLDVFPLSKSDSQNYSEARVYLDKETYVPYAVRLVDPAGNGSTEYLFYKDKLRINQASITQWILQTDPFNPKLTLAGYKEIQAPGGVQPAGNQQPANPRFAAPPAGAPKATSKTAFGPR